MGVGPARVATNRIVRKQVLCKQEREQLFDDDYAVESEKEAGITLRVGLMQKPTARLRKARLALGLIFMMVLGC